MIRSRAIRGMAAALAFAVPAATGVAQPPAPDAIVAGRYMTPEGRLEADVAIVLSDGKIERVTPAAEFKPTERTVHFPNAVVTPGLVDVLSAVGALGQNQESMSAFDTESSVIDAVDFRHDDFGDALEAGVTSVMIVPAPVNLIAGAAAVVKTRRVDGPGTLPNVLRKEGPLVGALGTTVWLQDREPTSRMGALALLRDFLDKARTGERAGRAHRLATERTRLVMYCESTMDVDAAIRTFGPMQAELVVAYDGDEHELAADLASETFGVIAGPFNFATPPRTLSAIAAYAAAGATVALAGQLPEAPVDSLRVSAALAVRYGLPAETARLAITSAPARLAGVQDRVGVIAAGLDADFAVFSDDPLRLQARVLAVYIEGVQVYSDDWRDATISSDEAVRCE